MKTQYNKLERFIIAQASFQNEMIHLGAFFLKTKIWAAACTNSIQTSDLFWKEETRDELIELSESIMLVISK